MLTSSCYQLVKSRESLLAALLAPLQQARLRPLIPSRLSPPSHPYLHQRLALSFRPCAPLAAPARFLPVHPVNLVHRGEDGAHLPRFDSRVRQQRLEDPAIG